MFDSDSGIFLELTYDSGEHYAESASWWIGVMASALSPSNRQLHYDRITPAALAATPNNGQFRNIATFRSKPVYNGRPNKIVAALERLEFLVHTVSADGAARLALIKGATPASAWTGWTDVNTSNSGLEYTTQDVLLTSTYQNRAIMNSTYVTSAQGSRPGGYSPGAISALQNGLFLEPDNGTYSIAVRFDAGTFNIDLSVEWLELF
jgi:hypothetical protein